MKSGNDKDDFAKIVWFCWLQGIDNAPYLVKKSLESWVKRNPSWKVEVIDEQKVSELTSLDFCDGNLSRLSFTARSDLIRLDLLATYGGVWVDSTCVCQRPLEDWLPQLLTAGFFAFSRPGRDRLISTWFLAAEAGNPLVANFFQALFRYWSDHKFRNDRHRIIVEGLTLLLRPSRLTARLWLMPLIQDWLGFSPYYAPHYIFDRMIRKDTEMQRVFRSMPQLSADGPHGIETFGMLSPISPGLRQEIDRREVPVYKLNRRISRDVINPDSALAYLLDSIS